MGDIYACDIKHFSMEICQTFHPVVLRILSAQWHRATAVLSKCFAYYQIPPFYASACIIFHFLLFLLIFTTNHNKTQFRGKNFWLNTQGMPSFTYFEGTFSNLRIVRVLKNSEINNRGGLNKYRPGGQKLRK